MTTEPAPNDTVLDPRVLPTARVEIVPRARVATMGPGREMPSGVFRADGSFVEASRTLISMNRMSAMPERPGDTEVRRLKGRHLFAGVGRHHFGHFLVEGIGRLWALDQDLGNIDGILVTPMHDKNIEGVMRRRLLPFYSLLCDAKPIWLIDHPAEVDELIVPTPGFGHLDWSIGSPEFRAFVRSRIAARIKPTEKGGPERVYISRSRLKSASDPLERELELERKLRKAGYVIFHPQKHTIEEQCQIYMGARQIIGSDGSAFHLAPFAMQPGTQVGLIQRRHRPRVFAALKAQIEAFAEAEVSTFDQLLPPKAGEAPPDPEGVSNLRALLRRLHRTGFL